MDIVELHGHYIDRTFTFMLFSWWFDR